MPRYRLFGLTLDSRHRFANRLQTASEAGEAAGEPADLELDVAAELPRHALPPAEPPLYVSPDLDRDGRSLLEVRRRGREYLFERLEVGRFLVGERRVVAVPEASRPDAAALAAVEVVFLGVIVAFWLERLGVPTLHGSAVDLGRGAVVFLGGNRGGKSSLAAALMERGATLLADDLAAVRSRRGGFVVPPGYPQMRFWPDAARRFSERAEELETVYPGLDKRRLPVGGRQGGRFAAAPSPLGAIVLLDRRDATPAAPRFDALPPAEALMILLRHSFLPRLVVACGWQPRRLEGLAAVVDAVPVLRLAYRSGYDHLPAAVDAVRERFGGG